ncbi:type III secretion system translocon subunit SctB, partial [Alcaligenes sp. Marseille-Q7550]
GCIPSEMNPESLAPTTQKRVKTAGITLESTSKPAGLEINGAPSGHRKALLTTMLPVPSEKAAVGDLLDKLNTVVVLLDILAVMTVLQQCSQQMRNQAREIRNAEMQSQITSLLNAADEICHAANLRLAAGILSATGQIAGCLISINLAVGGGALSMMGIARGDAGAGLKAFGDSVSGTAQGANTAMTGLGQIGSSISERVAASSDAKKARLEADARVHEQAAQQAGEIMQQMLEIIREVREKIAAIEQTKTETNRAIAGRV